MSPFERLGVDRNADEREIKRAYARLLKVTRPDDDPEGFQRLNKAYQTALAACAANADMSRRRKPKQAPRDPPMFSVDIRLETPPQANFAPSPVQTISPPGHGSEVALPGIPSNFRDLRISESNFNARDFIDQLHAFASSHKPHEIAEYLSGQPDLLSIKLKNEMTPSLVRGFLDKPPLPPRQLDAVLVFFGLERVSPPLLELTPRVSDLRRRSREAFPEIRDVVFKPRGREKEHSYLPYYMLWGVIVLLTVWTLFEL